MLLRMGFDECTQNSIYSSIRGGGDNTWRVSCFSLSTDIDRRMLQILPRWPHMRSSVRALSPKAHAHFSPLSLYGSIALRLNFQDRACAYRMLCLIALVREKILPRARTFALEAYGKRVIMHSTCVGIASREAHNALVLALRLQLQPV